MRVIDPVLISIRPSLKQVNYTYIVRNINVLLLEIIAFVKLILFKYPVFQLK